MKRIVLVTLAGLSICGFFSGCASSPYGSFLSATAPAPLEGVASDAARKLASQWRPAKTHIALQHPTDDPFGAVFVASLRGLGYSVLEFIPAGKAATANTLASDGDSVPVSYVLDRAGDVYRLKLLAGREVLSRAYAVNAGQFAPAGAWSALRLE